MNHDISLAGKLLIIIFLLFGLYSILHGLSILKLLPINLINIFDSRSTTYLLYILFGIILILFYTLVVFTNLKISKNMTHITTYEIGGIASGVLFFISLFIIILYDNLIVHKIPLFNNYNILLLLIIICLTVLISFIIIKALRIYKYNKIMNQYVISLPFVVLNALH